MKWLIAEDGRELAVALYESIVGSGGTIVAPAHVYSEMSSAMYKRYRAGELPALEAQTLLDQGVRLPIRVVSPPGLPRRAFEIAVQFRMKWIYDALYIALAEMIGCELWTADERLHEQVRGAYPNVRLLAEFRPA